MSRSRPVVVRGPLFWFDTELVYGCWMVWSLRSGRCFSFDTLHSEMVAARILWRALCSLNRFQQFAFNAPRSWCMLHAVAFCVERYARYNLPAVLVASRSFEAGERAKKMREPCPNCVDHVAETAVSARNCVECAAETAESVPISCKSAPHPLASRRNPHPLFAITLSFAMLAPSSPRSTQKRAPYALPSPRSTQLVHASRSRVLRRA